MTTEDMKGKRCLITGATAGIGEVAAIDLAGRGADVVIVGRNEQKCKATLEKMKATGGGGDLSYLVADLSSYAQVNKLAADYRTKFDKLNILINNAGAIFFSDERSVDGLEMTWALNHFGYYWLTMDLLDVIKASAPARIINVSSAAHQRARLNKDKPIDEKNSFAYFTYGNTKLANVLFTKELARQLEGTGVTVNALHPGVVATRFGANNGIPGTLFNLATSFIAITCEAGAKTIIYLATSPDVENVTGKYFVKEREVNSSGPSKDPALATALWNASEEVTRKVNA